MRTQPSGRTALTPRVPVVIIVFLAASSAAWPVLTLLQSAIGLDPEVIRLTQFSTALGALAVWLIWRDRIPFPETDKHGFGSSILAAVCLPLAALSVLALITSAVTGPLRILDISSLAVPFPVLLCSMLLAAAGEEIGWYGLVQPLLETRMPRVWAGVVSGLLFGAGHFYVIALGIPAYAIFVVAAVGISLLCAAATAGRGWKERVIAATALHTVVNAGLFVFFPGGDSTVQGLTLLAISFSVIAVACIPYLVRSNTFRRAERAGRAIDASRFTTPAVSPLETGTAAE